MGGGEEEGDDVALAERSTCSAFWSGPPAAVGLIALWAADTTALWVRIPLSLGALAVITAGYLYPIVRYVKRAEASVTRRTPRPRPPACRTPPRSTADTKSAAASALRAVVGRLLLAAALSGVALLGTWAAVQKAADVRRQDDPTASRGSASTPRLRPPPGR